MDQNFTIQESDLVELEGLSLIQESVEFFGSDKEVEIGSKILSLQKSLEVAVKHNRSYQNRKELLYLQALSLSLERHRFNPIFSGNLSGGYGESRTEIETGVDTVVRERSVNFGGRAGMDLLLKTGGRIAVDFASDFLRFVTGDPRVSTSSALVGTFTQPLLRGAGARIAVENLTQAERDMLYEMRDFTLFRKDFTIEVASAYYDVLQNRDTVENSWRGLQSFRKNVERSKALAEEGRLRQAELDRLKQAELSTETGWINAVRNYRQSLDRFKILLGLSPEFRIVLDEAELTKLAIIPTELTADQATEIALVTRLELYSQKERVEDSTRKVEVAANRLKPQFDLVAGGAVNRSAGNQFPTLDFKNYSWEAGLDVDLPFDRKSERNSYKSALIAQKRAVRELDLSTANIRLEIANDWRNLSQAEQNYRNSELGVSLSEKRVEEQQLLAELGRGTALDLVDAENDLINARIQSTEALVNHTIARLRFWRNMGILFIHPDGQWEVQNAMEKTRN